MVAKTNGQLLAFASTPSEKLWAEHPEVQKGWRGMFKWSDVIK